MVGDHAGHCVLSFDLMLICQTPRISQRGAPDPRKGRRKFLCLLYTEGACVEVSDAFSVISVGAVLLSTTVRAVLRCRCAESVHGQDWYQALVVVRTEMGAWLLSR